MKYIKLLFFIFISIFLQSCSFDSARYINFEESPSSNYYAEKIKEHLSNDSNYTLDVFDTNLYKYFKVDDEDLDVLKNFVNNLSDEDFLDEFTFENKEKV